MKIYTVEQINNYIRNMFDTDFVLNRVSVTGEVSNCKYHPSGHIYFTVKDNNNALAVIMFAGSRGGLDFRLENGMKIVVTGKITVFARDGKYQLYASKIEPAGRGELYEKYLALKKELEEMGMFDAMYKQPIPYYSAKVGVVTASTGAAIQDIINVSKRRNPYVQIVLYPALVQGDGAVESVCRGIAALERYGVDVMIVGRGGGSIEDLWAFNDEKVARAIFECGVPVISAVGHETDFTIADFVADMRAPTPSAAAELAVCDMEQLMNRIDAYRGRLNDRIHGIIDNIRYRTDSCRAKLEALSPAGIIERRKHDILLKSRQLDTLMNNIINNRRNELKIRAAKFEALSPIARLTGGYSYVEDSNGAAVTSVDMTAVGDILTVNVSDGIIHATVTDTKKRVRQG